MAKTYADGCRDQLYVNDQYKEELKREIARLKSELEASQLLSDLLKTERDLNGELAADLRIDNERKDAALRRYFDGHQSAQIAVDSDKPCPCVDCEIAQAALTPSVGKEPT